MPNTSSSASSHSLVVVKDNLFVISDTCEVFDDACKQFVVFKSPRLRSPFVITRACSIGSKILVIQDEPPYFVCYDVEEGAWSEELCQAARNRAFFSYVQVPFV